MTEQQQQQILNLLHEQGKAFEAMKEANDRRLEALENNRGAGELAEQVTRIQAELKSGRDQIEALEKEIALNKTPEFGNKNLPKKELKEQLINIFRGDFKNAVRTDSDPDGGFAVPEGLDKEIDKYVMEDVKMLKLCTVAPFIADYKKDVTITGGTVADGTEGAILAETDTPTIARAEAVTGKLLAKAKVTEEAKRDLMFSPETWVRENISMVMAEVLEQRLLGGSGTAGQTKGLLMYPNADTADAERPFGTVQFVKTGVNGGFAAFDAITGRGPLDCLKDARASLKSAYRRNARWLMNTATENLIQQLKDSDGNYLWQPGLVAGEPDRLLGYPVEITDFLPDPAADSLSIVFGDFKRAVRIGYDNYTYVVRDNITAFPNIMLLFSKYYDLTLKDSRALKFIKFAL